MLLQSVGNDQDPLDDQLPSKRPLKGTKTQDIDEDIISEKYEYIIKDWENFCGRFGYELSTECFLCDNDWLITFKSTDHHTEYSSLYITNLSKKSITAGYVIRIKNRRSENDVVFTDPEESVVFEPHGGGDDSWGTDELMYSSHLNDESYGFIQDNCLHIEIEIQICGIVKSSATLLSKAIENATGTTTSIFSTLILIIAYLGFLYITM